ncbi:MAG TPA: choice-of-anchor tandem repeat GloVer-containing protein, partial [Thermoanaerobaculia bacterium]|nr:choice-of-anchor tandem repeat GloVer-containing protein [Thermoanaerobaculia bacterium]
PDGNFYGTTASGGAANAQGNVIRITPAGSVTVLHEFNHTQGADDDGMWPVAGLIRAADGNFYGTTRAGGANSLGNVFRIGSAGAYATIHSFSGGDGNAPYGNLLQGADGKLYGTTYGGGAYGHGTVFSIDTTGTGFTTLHSLTLEEGSGPVGGLIQATDGKLYGVTDAGGPGKAGVVFRLTLPGCTPPSPPTAGNNGPVCAGSSLQLTASTIAGAAYAWTGPNGFSSTLQNPSIASATAAASGTYSVTATVAGCTSAPATTVATVIASCVASKFYPLTPCRIADTRNAVGPLGGPALSAGASRTFPVTGTCSVPSTARALSLNVTVTGATVAGDLKLYADGAAVPVSTALSYRPTVARANNAFAAPSASGGLAVYCSQPSGTVQLILDVNGYFQ